ncbi:flagellar biosynthesis protein FliQ [Neomoorella thermoacetica]|uniref:Flagellar biosynthetic protein FliQ n=2 Tax=Neomoorella thermoacetica TaxID=1525 RepID=A0A1D7X980_NEOTH|nr:flagellar biosynthesis protein FliQ [Moorella thermoacetica]AKX93536.1 flagellar biosynthetic protein FliQ [Moorella thermoacetica]AKX96183.1 flagellar biosynthetic protein FliQ [Moorella thermoacetica]AOQ23444.1 Flagellar biosynthetic protein FliQ [Moorella thermoacetica]OIQ09810.1 flagellar biosynthetic protein FliQ [Moorella thermoacetica]OIQ12508.1 flagellar biosynthetic protein FliQ [Moorella thermoacetica]
MTQEFVIHLAREALTTALLLAAPALSLSLLVGVGISILQATTQIQEQTLTFVPKIIAVILGMLLLGSWMLNTLIQFTTDIFGNLGSLVK